MIYLFNGPPGSGKDKACEYFSDWGYIHLSFKEQLVTETINHYQVSRSWFMDCYDDRSIKEKPEEILNGLSRRGALIHVSEDLIKPKHGNSYFGNVIAAQIDSEHNYCISDGGFIEEIVPLINKIGEKNLTIIQLSREGCDYSKDSRRYFDGNLAQEFVNGFKTEIFKKHILATKLNVQTILIHNNGTLNDFVSALSLIFSDETDKEQNVTSKESKTRN